MSSQATQTVGSSMQISTNPDLPVVQESQKSSSTGKTGFLSSVASRGYRTVSYGVYYGYTGAIRGICKGVWAGLHFP